MEMSPNMPALPVFKDDSPVGVGSRVKVADGSIILVKTIILAEDGVYVSNEEVGKRAFKVDGPVLGPDDDTDEQILADSRLTPKEYVRRRALELEEGENPVQAMISDLMRRQKAMLGGY